MNKTLLLVLGLVCGCASVPPVRNVRFESAPPGARVFITYGVSHKQASQSPGDYLGTTPCTAPIAVESDGTFTITKKVAFVNNFGEPRTALIVAQLNGVSVTNVYHASAFAREGDQVPAAVFFQFPP
jgi:hypothetical protein